MSKIIKEREAFNFYRSYFDVFNQLNNAEKLKFITALLEKQFENCFSSLKIQF